MDKYRLQWVGSKCGQHGPYTFFKGFKFLKNSKWRTISLGEFFFVKCSENDPLCIAELQLLWEDKGTEGIMLSSLRLYFLPEHTPDGRHHSHGENEVIAVNGKAIMSIEDLLEWVIMEDVRWIDGFPTICPNNHASRTMGERQGAPSTTTTEEQGGASTFQGVASKNQDGDAIDELPLSRLRSTDEPATNSNEPCKDTDEDQKLMVVSYPSYCRYHGNLKRIEKQGDKWHSNPLLKALGLLSMPHPHTKLLFCRDEFDHPIMEEDERLCEYTAPKLKGRPRKKKVKLKSDDDRYEPPRNHTGSHNLQNTFLLASKRTYRVGSRRSRDRLELGSNGADTLAQLKAEFRMGRVTSEELFLTHLYKYMKDRNTPIDRVPHLGFKQLDLFAFFELAVKLGGYRSITSQKQWKVIYDQLGGNPNSTSAATCTRKHYERLLFPFEQHLRMPDKPADMCGAKDKKKKKDKKDKKRSRVKHVREQLQELEAWRQAERRAQEQMLEQAGLNSVVMRETSASVSTVTTTVPTSTATITPSMTVSGGEVKPAMSINGMPIMTMPPMMAQSSVVQLQGGHLYPHQLGLKNMGPVILAIPQVPVLAATTVPKQERDSPAVGHQAAEDQKQPLQQQPVPQSQPSTVLDKVSSGASLIQQGEKAEVKQGEAVAIKIERTHSVMNNSVVKEERGLLDHSRHTKGVDSKLVRRASPVNNLNNVTLGELRSGSQESLLPRPSVIQHTHPKKVKLESDVPSGLINSPLASAVQPNDLILRNMTKEQFAAEHEHYKKVVAEMPGLLGAGPRFLSPYMTFLPQSPLLYRPPVELNNQAVMSIAPSQVTNKLSQYEFDDSKSKSLLPEPTPVKPHASMVPPIRSSSSASSSSSSSSASSASSSRSVKYEPVPEQEEPCDLSMPKKLKRYYDNVREDEIYGKRRPSVISNANLHSTNNVIRNSPVHRLRTSDKKVRKRSSSPLSNSREHHAKLSSSSSLHSSHSAPLMASSSLLGMAPKVKMTPNPRGSITQGIIDPATNQTHPSLLHKLPIDPSKAPTPKSLAQDLVPQHFPLDFPAALSLPMAVDSMGKPLQPLTDLSHLTRFPMLPYYPMLPRPTFLPAGSPFLQGLVPGIPTSQAESMLQQGLFFRPPFPFAPSVPYSTAQLPRDSTQASLYRS